MNIGKIVKKPARIFMAYLAEEYDGIGQYVHVTMARSSTSVALLARVAAGDFNGQRTFPAGTRVPVVSIRGSLEVLLGNHPAPFVPAIQPVLNRSAAAWGNVAMQVFAFLFDVDADDTTLFVANNGEVPVDDRRVYWCPLGPGGRAGEQEFTLISNPGTGNQPRLATFILHQPTPAVGGYIRIDHTFVTDRKLTCVVASIKGAGAHRVGGHVFSDIGQTLPPAGLLPTDLVLAGTGYLGQCAHLTNGSHVLDISATGGGASGSRIQQQQDLTLPVNFTTGDSCHQITCSVYAS